MKVIILDGSKLTSKEVFHKTIKNQLNFPSYYGENLDALWDCLTEITHPIKITWNNFYDSEKFLGDYCDKILNIFLEASNYHGSNFIFKVDKPNK
ncbi:barstar family protein [Clostridium hydrogeniformans]|uniref:barstar family protein n=1 Tax=Clostridium hydrogeniformans TaxID=349933 RepID=UPI0004815098|nr:barstar family protein [Clostridium hydrogeniformans]